MFFRLTKYTPSGFPKKVPLNHKNKTEYNKMVDANLKAKKQFMEWQQERQRLIDEKKRKEQLI